MNLDENSHDFVVVDVWAGTQHNPICVSSISIGYVPIQTDEKMYVGIKKEEIYWICSGKYGYGTQRLVVYNINKNKIIAYAL